MKFSGMSFIHVFFVLIAVFTLCFASAIADEEKKADKEDKKIEPLVMVINYPYQIWSNSPTKIHVVLFKPDFTPAKGANVKVNGKETGKSDENGVFIFDFTPGSNTSHSIIAELTEEDVTYRVTKTFAANQRTASYKADSLYVYTDRGVYNPGQDILIRMIAWELKGEYKAIPNAKIQLLFQDKNGKVFTGDSLLTNDFGVASTKIPLAENMPEGDYKLVVLYNKARQETSIRVKRFVPPTIRIDHDMKRYMTDNQKTFETNIKLSYFAGGTFKGSNLEFSILQNNNAIFTKKYSSDSPEYIITLNEEELAEIKKKLKLETFFKIKVAVTDIYEQKNEIIWDCKYTGRPFTAIIELDKDAYKPNEKVQLLAKVVDLDNQPAKEIPLVLEIGELKLNIEAKTDDHGIAVFEFEIKNGSVQAVLKSTILNKPLASRSVPIQLNKPMMSKSEEMPKSADMKTKITVNFDENYIPVEKVVHVDMTDISGSLVVATTIPVFKEVDERNKKVTYYAQGEVASPTWGTMLVNIYVCAIEKKNEDKKLSVNNVGFITEGQHITFHPNKTLEIVVENFKDKAAPGEELKFKVHVKGGKSEKLLGISIVDDAVLNLLDPFIKNPVNHFYNPKGKVISTSGSGVLTWPVVDRNWGSPWRDIAYTNWGWKAPGGFVGGGGNQGYGEGGSNGADKNESGDSEGPTWGDDAAPEEDPGDDAKEPELNEKLKSDAPSKENSELTKDELLRSREAKIEKPKTIVIRKKFPETSLWLSDVITKEGFAEFTAIMPDAITTQKLSIVATDKSGYIGLSRKNIQIIQPLFVRSLVPAEMKLGDKISVQAIIQNFSDNEITGKATFSSKTLNIDSESVHEVKIPKGESKVVYWVISAQSCGSHDFMVSFETENFKDSEQKKIFVAPVGTSVVSTLSGSVEGKGSFSVGLDVKENADYTIANLNISLPNVFPAIQAWYAYDVHPMFSPWSNAASVIMNAAMLDYLRNTDAGSDKIALIKNKLHLAASILSSSQMNNGAWGWWFLADSTAKDNRPYVGGENLYYTLYVLRALAELRRADFPVDDSVMLKAIKYIINKRDENGLWASKGAYFWETFNDATDWALSAEIFEVLTMARLRVPKAEKFDAELAKIKDKMLEMLAKKTDEPMVISAAIQGLINYSKIKGEQVDKEAVQEYIDYLIELKRTGYWEPHWYHAYGGMIELNARILELLSEYDSEKYEAYLREGVTYLLSTREAWGAWHNEIGTATAIRALLKTGTFNQESDESYITIKINGEVFEKIKIDKNDPFLSAAKLRFIEITRSLKKGKNEITVEYSGNLKASVKVELKQWGVKDEVVETKVKVKREMPEKASVGQPVVIKITITTDKMIPMLILQETIPANASVETESLNKLRSEGKIVDFKVNGNVLEIILVKVEGEFTLEYKIKGVYTGFAKFEPTRIITTENNIVIGKSEAKDFTVE